MGIRFLCHHCEKRLNVKATQAGMTGQCPHCFEAVVVPPKSTIPSTLQKHKQLRRRQRPQDSDSFVGLHSVDEQVTIDGPTPGLQTESTKKAALQDSGSQSSTELFMLDKPQPPESRGKVDPIAEAPDRVWYFRSRELGERGPLKGKVMQRFLDQGDVKIGCIVWREDWDDWILAEEVFPRLVREARTKRKKDRVGRAFKEANYEIPDEFDAHSDVNLRRRRKNRIFYSLIGAAFAIITILALILIQLLSK